MSSLKDTYFFTSWNEGHRTKDLGQSSTTETKAYKSARTLLYGKSSDCGFCGDEFKKGRKQHYSGMINKALYSKYSSSQNYYYSKDVNEILADQRTESVIKFKDYIHYDEEDEYLKRFYRAEEYDFKINMLVEYYKFHNDIARLFMMPITNVVNKHHDKKRRLEYLRVTKMLKEEQEGKEPAKPRMDEKKLHREILITDRILDELQLTDPDLKKTKRESLQSTGPYIGKPPTPASWTDLNVKPLTGNKHITNSSTKTYGGKNVQQKLEEKEAVKEVSVSNTIQDLNAKLGEIISSKSRLDTNYLDTEQTNETISNLTDFLLFLNSNNQIRKLSEIQSIQPINTRDPTQKDENMTLAAPLTDRILRPEYILNPNKSRQPSRGDLIKPSEPYNRMISPTGTKLSARSSKNIESLKEKYGERPVTREALSKAKSNQFGEKTKSISNIRNFEEAIKMNMQSYQQKMLIHSAVPSRQLQEKVPSANTSKNTNRTKGARTPSKHYEDRSHETSTSRQKVQLYNGNTSSHSGAKIKKRSSDMYTKTLDLLLGSSQGLITSSHQKKEAPMQSMQSGKHTRSSMLSKGKTPSQQFLDYNERSLGKEDFRFESGQILRIKKSPSRMPGDLLFLQTDREGTRGGNFENLALYKRESLHVPMTERDLYKSKSHTRSNSRTGMKGVVVANAEHVQSLRSGIVDFMEKKKSGYHKYTKSEGRLKKPDPMEKIEYSNNTRVLMNNGSHTSRPKAINISPKRQSYSSNNNMVNVFLNSASNKKSDKSLVFKFDRSPYNEDLYSNYKENESMSKTYRSRSPNADNIVKLGSQLPQKLNLDFSPLKVLQRDGSLAGQIKILSDRSSASATKGFTRHQFGRNDYESLRRDL